MSGGYSIVCACVRAWVGVGIVVVVGSELVTGMHYQQSHKPLLAINDVDLTPF